MTRLIAQINSEKFKTPYSTFKLLSKLWISIGFIFLWIDKSSAIQLVYSSMLTPNSDTFSRGCQLSNYHYEALEISVIKEGCYTFESKSSMDMYGYVYKNFSNLLNPPINLVFENDNFGENHQFHLVIRTKGDNKYVLVATTSSPNVTGPFSIVVSGPANVTLKHISEYSYYLIEPFV